MHSKQLHFLHVHRPSSHTAYHAFQAKDSREPTSGGLHSARILDRRRLGSKCRAGFEGNSNEDILAGLLSMGDDEMREKTSKVADSASIDFMTWLQSREQKADGEEKAVLNQLGGKLTAIREGIDPVAASKVMDDLRGAGEVDKALQIKQAEPGSDALVSQIEQRRAELARRMAMDAVLPAQLAKEQVKATEFTEALRENRAASVAAMIGRAPVEMAQARKGLDAAAAADRILEMLLSLESREERLALVPEAFVPPQEFDGQDKAPDVDLIYTSPMRLLQAVSLALSRLNGVKSERREEYLPLDLESLHMSNEERRTALLEIKKAVFVALDQEDEVQ